MKFQISSHDFRLPQVIAKSQKLTALEKVVLLFLFNNFKGDLTIDSLSKFTLEPRENIVSSIQHLIEIKMLVVKDDIIEIPSELVTAAGWLPTIKKTVKKKVSKAFVPPSLDEWVKYFLDNGYKKEIAETAWKIYDTANWHDTHGKPVLNWKQKAVSVWFKEEHKQEWKKKIATNIGLPQK